MIITSQYFKFSTISAGDAAIHTQFNPSRPSDMSAAVITSPLLHSQPRAAYRKNFSPLPTVKFELMSCTRRVSDDTNEHYFSRKSLKYWDKFYRSHQDKFFKDRHYLKKDWAKYLSDDDDNCAISANGKVGFGAGNTIFPLSAAYPKLFIHACDFSSEALALVKSHSSFNGNRLNVFMCDVTSEELCDKIPPSSVDVVTLIFMLSAVSPNKMPLVIQNLKKVLKSNGHVLFRDYAVGDFAQVKLNNKNQSISDNFYYRGDGTNSGKIPGVGLIHAPISLLPTPFPESHWKQACEVAPIFNELVDRVSLNSEFLQESLSRTKRVDAFTARLLDIHAKILDMNKREVFLSRLFS
ncbi:methyltransferase [Striga asiatica]|uniref:Methyltransferase n=1 Tax=Striga asiatica TaxID=4170 RepID=A0A5A7RAZ8_STRAF|nr:methyltransferase [Striga asiatica]